MSHTERRHRYRGFCAAGMTTDTSHDDLPMSERLQGDSFIGRSSPPFLLKHIPILL